MTRLLHISDIHFGPHHLEQRSACLPGFASEHQVEAVVVSGDLVQRAFSARQYRAARGFLDSFGVPVLVVPGNHDLPLVNQLRRWIAPRSLFRRYIQRETEPVLQLPGVTIVGVDTTFRFRMVGGWVLPADLERLRTRLRAAPAGDCRMVVGHHPLFRLTDHRIQQLWGARPLRQILLDEEVAIYLCGHVHVSHVERARAVDPRLPGDFLYVQCGTSTSRRGRAPEAGRSSLFVIDIDSQAIRVTPHVAGARFEAQETLHFARPLTPSV